MLNSTSFYFIEYNCHLFIWIGVYFIHFYLRSGPSLS